MRVKRRFEQFRPVVVGMAHRDLVTPGMVANLVAPHKDRLVRRGEGRHHPNGHKKGSGASQARGKCQGGAERRPVRLAPHGHRPLPQVGDIGTRVADHAVSVDVKGHAAHHRARKAGDATWDLRLSGHVVRGRRQQRRQVVAQTGSRRVDGQPVRGEETMVPGILQIEQCDGPSTAIWPKPVGQQRRRPSLRHWYATAAGETVSAATSASTCRQSARPRPSVACCMISRTNATGRVTGRVTGSAPRGTTVSNGATRCAALSATVPSSPPPWCRGSCAR
ncbi:hypothetical protein ATI53_1002134 [Salipiger aestuarii]|uniref:Uncharacterized protein n=1 Tax=Salipiger aestuarii TaxID=568098 RepID=A0A327YTA3_9RHOB|nr:hypothetical protein ATI53_1002134 [Salipiger aestuarii]